MSARSAAASRLADSAPLHSAFEAEFVAGLRRRPRMVPCKFFYDERGSRLFERICELPEYYPTRTEIGILERNAFALSSFCGPRCRLVELGSGSSRKTRILLDHLVAPAGYIPIDISRSSLDEAAARLALEYPWLEILPVCADYGQRIELPAPKSDRRRTTIFFPGSTIGNFEPVQATVFLEHIGTWCRSGDRMLIGVDLEKPRAVLEAAYNDAQGVTAAFNLNLLARANAELGADFDASAFCHRATYHEREGRIEMHLVSKRDQVVHIAGETFAFGRNEAILTEFSYKYRPADFSTVAAAAGWQMVDRWSDPKQWFSIFALERGGG